MISGGLTLLGVIHTINAQDKKDRRNTLPKRTMISESIFDDLIKIKKFYDEKNDLDLSDLYLPEGTFSRLKKETSGFISNKKSILEEAAQVSFEFYYIVYNFMGEIEKIYDMLNTDIESLYIDESRGHLGYDRYYHDDIKLGVIEMQRLLDLLIEEIINIRKEFNYPKK